MNLQNIISMLTLLGLGGVLGTYFRILWERKNSALIQKQEFKETRYKCVILLLLSYLDFNKFKSMLQNNGRENIKTSSDLYDELKVEWHNMILYASFEVLETMHLFIEKPSQAHFNQVAFAMRNDLWGGKLSLRKLDGFAFSK